MTLQGAKALKDLTNKDLRALVGVEVGMKHSQYVEVDEIARYAGYSANQTSQFLKKCHKLNLVRRWTGHFTGYELTIHGYDSLALNALYESGKVISIGREKGVGKESKVYYALSGKEKEIVLKLHRVGYSSFQHVKKKRRYTANKHHISELYSSRLSAEEEYKWLSVANKVKLNVPQTYGINRHIIAMELIDGIDLHKLSKLPNPKDTFQDVLDFVYDAWNKGKFVHGDLSEHNIIMNQEAKPIIIDFPQAVGKDSVGALDLLTRDVKNVLTYFDRKYGITIEEESVIANVLDS
jgi:RIO kinase 2